MKTSKLLTILGILLLTLAACHRQAGEKEAIRTSIRQHVASMSGLRMDAMEMELTQVTLNGDHAEALAAFRPKQAATPMVLQVKYQLEKRDGSWVVLNSQTLGGQMSHPPATPAPSQVNPPGALPPGHPPLTPSQSPTQTPPAANPHP
jgi:hypothetical protein